MIDNLKNKSNKIILYLIFVLPFLDIYRTLVGNRFEIFGFSLVEIFHFIFVGILFLLLFIKEKKCSKKIFILVLIYLIYIILHLAYIVSIKDISFINYSVTNKDILIEIYYIVKSYILPLIILYVFMRSDIKVNDIIDTLSKVSFIFSIIVVVTNLLGVSLVAYNSDVKNATIKGTIISWFSGIKPVQVDLYTSKGLFYSTNQLSAVLGGLLFISAFYTLHKDDYKHYISFFIKALATLMISTKTAFFSIFFSIISVLFYLILKYIINKKNEFTKKSILFLLIAIVILILYNYSPIKIKMSGYIQNQTNEEENEWEGDEEDIESNNCLSNLEERYNFKLNKIDSKNMDKLEEEFLIECLSDCPNVFNLPSEYINFYPPKLNFDFWIKIIKGKTSVITNNRRVKNLIYNDFLEKHDNFKDELFGIGYISNFPYLEKDIIGQKVWVGYIGILIFIFPYILLFVISCFKIVIRMKNKFNLINISLLLSSAFMFFASIFAGHVFGNFVPNTILAIIIATLYKNSKKNESTVELKNKKISFLLLHLGYGGIESSTINTANALSSKYDIEIMSFYKLDKDQIDKFNDKINVVYLYNDGPNRKEFNNALHNHNIFEILKEGIKSVSILIKKKINVINYIYNCDSKYVVSTRYDFSILLSKYGNNNAIKIAQEHHYHNDDKKYINVLKTKYFNIDYLFALTKTLENDYRKFLKNNNHTKIVLVPNMLYNIPDKESSLNEKNIITISRLDSLKKNDDIIRAFSKIKEKSWKLYIIGDGTEINNLKNLIKELNIEGKVILTGYKNKSEIEKYMLESSLFLMASVTEGLPMVLLEAMSYGIPCIAYETASGVNDIINNEKNGFVVQNREEKEYISCINKLITNEKIRKEMGKCAKQSVNNFSKEEILKKWYKILGE